MAGTDPAAPTNLTVLPADAFDSCESTTGSTEVIKIEQSGETWLALDIIGAYGLHTVAFSIDEHELWVYAVDGDYIEPQRVDAIRVANGDRYSVMLKLERPGDYTVRAASLTITQMIEGFATISYRNGDGPALNRSSIPHLDPVGRNLTAGVVFFSQAAMKAFPPHAPAAKADETFQLQMSIGKASYLWSLNGTGYPSSTLDNATPLLFEPKPYVENNVTISTRNGSWVDLILIGRASRRSHPIHKHGAKMWLIGGGLGAFDYSSVEEAMEHIPQNFNLVDPPFRDSFATLEASSADKWAWLAIRYHVTNPGAWFLHCHIEGHMVGGMAMAIQDGVDAWPVVPPEYLDMA